MAEFNRLFSHAPMRTRRVRARESKTGRTGTVQAALNCSTKTPGTLAQERFDHPGQLRGLVMVQHVARILDDGHPRIGNLPKALVVFGQ